MSGEDKTLLAFAVWALVAFVIAGVAREVNGKVGDTPLLAAAWPLLPCFAAIVAIGWALMWLGRGPARLVVRLQRRRRQANRIARAEVHRG